MDYSLKSSSIMPRIIIHGGAGNITRENMPTESYNTYRNALLKILRSAYAKLNSNGATALNVATYAVSLMEENPLFNSGCGAVYTTAGTHELEASVMVSNGYRKRGVGVMKVRKAKSPITLAKEMLIRGELPNGGGAQGHCQLEGETCDRLAEEWGLELVKPSYFWTRKRWDEHRKGLGLPHDDETYEKHKREADGENSLPEKEQNVSAPTPEGDEFELSVGDIHWDGKEYLPQGTVGAVALDSYGTICVATSTGGLTNKLPGRIGDTPTLGAGFWSERWIEVCRNSSESSKSSPLSQLTTILSDCLPILHDYTALPSSERADAVEQRSTTIRAVGMSGTGNGDSFLRLNAVRTAAAIVRYASSPCSPAKDQVSLQQAVTAVAGPYGQLQRSAEDRWLKTGEGEGGIIGIELVNGKGHIVYDYNCGGMFHAWVDDDGMEQFALFQDERMR